MEITALKIHEVQIMRHQKQHPQTVEQTTSVATGPGLETITVTHKKCLCKLI